MRLSLLVLILWGTFSGCLEQTDHDVNSGAALAHTYCGTCHQFPSPGLLDKKTWERSILPLMGEKLGISSYNGKYVAFARGTPDTSSSPANSSVSYNEWLHIVDYYLSLAPDTLPRQNRAPIKEFTERFTIQPVVVSGNTPSTCMVKIDPGNKLIYAATMYDSLLLVFDQNMHIKQKLHTGKVFVDMSFGEHISIPGSRTGILTNIGNFLPNADAIGSLEAFKISGSTIRLGNQVANTIARPVSAVQEDMNMDGTKEILVSAFGHEKGELFLLTKSDTGIPKKTILRSFPGAGKPSIADLNQDGRKDIIALFSQGDEGIFLYTYQPGDKFFYTPLLKFSPVNGSTHIELADMNGDGLQDILYTCGDNYDYSRILKNYHGIYIFMNKGNNRFVQQYFFPVHGCYKAIAKDFDNDGDLDIASISFFPDVENQPGESFVYLENSGNLNFLPYTIKESFIGRWITMDTGDVDGDGDEDIVIGSLILKNTDNQKQAMGMAKKPSLLVLRNKSNN